MKQLRRIAKNLPQLVAEVDGARTAQQEHLSRLRKQGYIPYMDAEQSQGRYAVSVDGTQLFFATKASVDEGWVEYFTKDEATGTMFGPWRRYGLVLIEPVTPEPQVIVVHDETVDHPAGLLNDVVRRARRVLDGHDVAGEADAGDSGAYSNPDVFTSWLNGSATVSHVSEADETAESDTAEMEAAAAAIFHDDEEYADSDTAEEPQAGSLDSVSMLGEIIGHAPSEFVSAAARYLESRSTSEALRRLTAAHLGVPHVDDPNRYVNLDPGQRGTPPPSSPPSPTLNPETNPMTASRNRAAAVTRYSPMRQISAALFPVID